MQQNHKQWRASRLQLIERMLRCCRRRLARVEHKHHKVGACDARRCLAIEVQTKTPYGIDTDAGLTVGVAVQQPSEVV